ncbi:hypothetical protein A3K93_01820 [Acinetobacter sp. NCu2D-2]|nr:hypothetical protein A3K93_01820 [Acinetobacter sp. NCu2D-2]
MPNDQPNKNLDWQKIDYLPDYWNQRWPDYVGTAWYKIEFNYRCSPPQEPLVLVISNITMAGEVFINDDMLWKDQSLIEPLSRSWNAPRQWSLPQSSLKQGQNIVWVKVVGVAIQPSGLGEVKIASQHIAQPIYEQYKFELNTLHIFSFLFSVILGFIGLIIWLFHRKDRSFAWYAINSFLWAMYLVHVLIREPIFALSTFEYHKINNILFGFYALASVMYGFSFANLRFKKIEWFLWTAVAISTLLILCLPEAQALQFIPLSFAFWVLVFLLNGCLYPIVAYKSKRKDTYFLAALGLVFVPIAIHDAMYMLSLEGGVAWSAYAQPVVAIAFAMILALRFSNNMKQIERFNDTLTTTIEQVKTDLSESLNKSHQLELQNTKLQERMNISHDLHDGLGSSLMRSMAIVQQSSKDLSNPQFLSMLKVLRDDLRQIIDQGSSLGAKIPDTPQQWIAPMRHRFNSLFDELDVRATWQIAAEWYVPISSIECLTLQRIIEEALTNVIKHSGADQIQIELMTKTDYLKLNIEDNGKGFDIDAVQQANMSVGMKSLNERAARIGAEFNMSSSAHGTCLEIIKYYQCDVLSSV